MSNIFLKSNNTNIKFMASASETASAAYLKSYQQKPDNNTLDGYLFFDLYSARIFLNGKQLSNSISKLKNKDTGEIIGYRFPYNNENIIVEYSSIGTFTENGIAIPADQVKDGLMSKSDKVSLAYLEDQIGFYVEPGIVKDKDKNDVPGFRIIEKTSKYWQKQMQWKNWQ